MKKILCVVFMFICLSVLPGCYDVSEGERVGTITKFSNKGFFIRTWEGEMILGGSGASGNEYNTFSFSVDQPSLVEHIKESQRTGKVVTLVYHQEWVKAPWRSDSNYFIDSVKN